MSESREQLWECSRRGCRWIGTDEKKNKLPDSLGYTLICPDCACDSFYKAKPGAAPSTNLRAQVQSLFDKYQALNLLQRDAAICHFFGGLQEVAGKSARIIKRRPCNAADVIHAMELGLEFGGKART